MPSHSHLTRQIFHRILSGQPIIHRNCLRRASSTRRYLSTIISTTRTSSRYSSRCPRLTLPTTPHRTFFNFNIFTRGRQEAREADVDPGIDKLSELAKRERMRARLLPVEEVADALTQFFRFRAKRKTGLPITDTQAQLALGGLRYLIKSYEDEKRGGESGVGAVGEAVEDGGDVGTRDADSSLFVRLGIPFRTVARVLRFDLDRPSEAHIELARLLYENTYSRVSLNRGMIAYVHLLTKTGATTTAREVLLRYEDQMRVMQSAPKRSRTEVLEDAEEESDAFEEDATDSPSVRGNLRACRMVLQGFARENNEVEVQRTLAMIRERGLDNKRAISATMLDFAVQRGDLAGVIQWWKTLHRQELESTTDEPTYFPKGTGDVLRWCLERGELQTGHEIVRELMTENPRKELWDAILVWAAGTKKSVDEIDRMMTVMEKSNASIEDHSQWRVPDIATINGLVEYAISRNDPYMAERFIALGRDRNIEPDARTLVLQMDYRLHVNDVDGALIAYKNLQSHDISSNSDVPTVNKLIVALCQTNRHDFDTIMNVAADLSDRRVRFDPATVSHLSILHLNRDETDDIFDLLNTHAFHFSSTERSHILTTLLNFALDPATPTSRAWATYTILHTSFDETSRAERTALLTSFLTPERKRADMAVRIFQQMRAHSSRPDTQPNAETYISTFLGLGTLREREQLEVVHNLLKLDPSITRSTRLLNALSLAYTACGRPRAALDFWDAVVASREGPSEASIHAVLRACERAPWGDVRAREIWSLLKRRGVETRGNQRLWGSYVAALAGNGDVTGAIGVLEQGVEEREVEVDVFVLGSLMAGAGRAGEEKQDEVERWAREACADVWAELEGRGWDVVADEIGGEGEVVGIRAPKIDRSLGP